MNTHNRPLHRLGDVRRSEGITRKTVARRLRVATSEVRRDERATTDLPLSKLYRWGKALEVPIAELLAEPEDALPQPLLQRAQLLRIMKTARTLLEQASEPAVSSLARTIVDQLIEIMPELRGVSAWPRVGTRRRWYDLGIAATRTLSEEVFIEQVG